MGDATTLTVDLGNGRCKLRLWHGTRPRPAIRARADLGLGDGLEAGLRAFLSQALVARAGLSSVAGAEATAKLLAVLESVLDCEVERPPAGLVNATEHPAEVGSDRLFAARGAFERLGASAIVVDAGTALTVDAVRVGAAGPPVFLGGAIAPGLRPSSEALARSAARLVPVEPDAQAPALGRSTRAALISGLVFGLRGAARELAREVAREADLDGARVALTGGDAELLSGVFADALADPDLVHVGLWSALVGEPPAGAARGLLERSGDS